MQPTGDVSSAGLLADNQAEGQGGNDEAADAAADLQRLNDAANLLQNNPQYSASTTWSTDRGRKGWRQGLGLIEW